MDLSFLNIFINGFVRILYGGDTIPVWLAICMLVLSAIIGYLLGSFNSAVILSKLMYHDDIRKYGSGNAGATNMMRVYGKNAALLTFLFDFLKAAVAVWIAILLIGEQGGYLAGAFCVVGHCFPLYYRFKGGKGVAVVAGICLVTNPIVFLLLLLVFVIIVGFTKYISLGSVMGMLMYPLLLNNYYKVARNNEPPSAIILLSAIFMAVFVIVQHRENIKRLRAGEESKFSFKKSVKTDKQISRDAHVEEAEDLRK